MLYSSFGHNYDKYFESVIDALETTPNPPPNVLVNIMSHCSVYIHLSCCCSSLYSFIIYVTKHRKGLVIDTSKATPNPPSGVIRYFNDIQCYWCVPVTIFMRCYIPHTYTDTPILYTGTCSNTELIISFFTLLYTLSNDDPNNHRY